MSKAEDAWLRCQHTIRKLLRNTGKDSLIYAKTALENEATEPEKLKSFWENARNFFEESDAKS